MAKKTEQVLAIDIGGSTLKMAEFSFGAGSPLTLERFAFQEMTGVDEDPIGAFETAYRDILRDNRFSSKKVRMTISGQSSFARLSKLPPIADPAGIGRIIEFEARQVIPYDMNEVVWDYQLIQHTVENEETGPEEEFEALFVAVKSDLVTAYTDIVQNSGKTILSVGVAPVSGFNAAYFSREADDSTSSVLLLNIGAKTTNLIISEGNRVFVRSIPIAGDTITQQISKEMNISIEDAEARKKSIGSVGLGAAFAEPESEDEATIAKIARNVMNRLHGEITRSINVWRSSHNGSRPEELWISGGASLMRYVPEFFKEKLRIPVDFLNVFGTVNIGTEIDQDALLDVAPMFPELIGIGLRCVATCPVHINLVPETIKSQRALQSKKPYFYISCGALLLCLGVSYWGVHENVDRYKKIYEEASRRFNKAKTLSNEVNSQEKTTRSVKNRYQQFVDTANARSVWADVLTDVQNILPDNIWLASLEPIGEEYKSATDTGNSRTRSRFALRRNEEDAKPAEKQLGKVTGVKLSCYSLDTGLNEEAFSALCKRVENSEFFLTNTAKQKGNIVQSKYRQASGKNNIASFEVTLKLKKPIIIKK